MSNITARHDVNEIMTFQGAEDCGEFWSATLVADVVVEDAHVGYLSECHFGRCVAVEDLGGFVR